jgi:4-amino-4-deoxy-L-arabinose transferase-like glycosyltransferase
VGLESVLQDVDRGEAGYLRTRLREAALVGLLAATLNLVGNDRISLWDRDEPRYATCTREMRASGDYIHPTFNGEPRYHKPVLIYWLMLGATAIGGDNPFGARLISALAGAGTCLLVWAWGRRMLGARAGLLAGLILATAPIMVAESKLATTDATLTLLVVGCQFALWELARRPSRGAAAAFWILLALAILTKAPAGPVLIVASGVASWLFGGPIACWTRLRWRWGPALCALLVVPWNVAILIRSQGAYYDVAVGYHIVRRLTHGIEEHGGFPGYYVVASLLTFYPWSALLPAAVAGAWARRRLLPHLGFLVGWIVGPLVILEFVRTKLIHYYLPSFPACALLVAWLINAVIESRVGLLRWPLGRVSFAILAALGTGASVILLAGAWVAPPGLRWPCLALGLLVSTATAVVVWLLRSGRVEEAVRGMVATMALFALVLGIWLLPAAEPYRLSQQVGARLAAIEQREHVAPVLCGFKPPGVIYALGHPARMYPGRDLLIEDVRGKGKAVAALLPDEIALLGADLRFRLELRERLYGFDSEKGKMATLQLTVIDAREPAVAGRQGADRRE